MALVAIFIIVSSLAQLQALQDADLQTGKIPPATQYEVSINAIGTTHIAANRGAKRAFSSRSQVLQDLALTMALGGESVQVNKRNKRAEPKSPAESLELYSVSRDVVKSARENESQVETSENKEAKPKPCKKGKGKHKKTPEKIQPAETSDKGFIGQRNFEARQPVSGSTPTGSVLLGTPPKELFMIYDTGSDKFVVKTWQTIKASIDKVEPLTGDLLQPDSKLYDHNHSSSYHAAYSLANGTNKSKEGFIAYGSGMAYTVEGADTVMIANTSGLQEVPISEIKMDTLMMLHAGGIAGILGLQHMWNKSLGTSIFSQLREKGVLGSFSYCRTWESNNGTFIWGDRSNEGTKIDAIGEMHWAVPLTNVHTMFTSEQSSQKDSAKTKDSKQKSKDDLEGEGKSDRLFHDANELMKFSESEDPGNSLSDGGLHGLLAPLKHLRAIVMDTIFAEPSAMLEKPDSEEKPHENKLEGAEPTAADRYMQKAPKAMDISSCTHDNGTTCVAVIDTGSNIIAMPSDALRQITDAVSVERDCSNFDRLPDIHFKLGSMNISLPPSAYVKKVAFGGLASEEGIKQSNLRGGKETQVGEEQMGGQGSKEERTDAQKESAGKLYSLVQQEDNVSRSDMHSHVEAIVQDVLANQGLNLKDMFEESELINLISEGSAVCMPVFVAIDRHTQKGPLWVVGSPLFDQYYTRWSFLKDESHPSVSFKELKQTKVCNENDHAVHTKVLSGTEANFADQGAGSLIRSDGSQELASGSFPQMPTEPKLQEIPIRDIRYPHWARNVDRI